MTDISKQALLRAERNGLPAAIAHQLSERSYSSIWGIAGFAATLPLFALIFSGFAYFGLADQWIPKLVFDFHVKEEGWLFFASTTGGSSLAYVFASIGIGSLACVAALRLVPAIERYNGFTVAKKFIEQGNVGEVIALVDEGLMLHDPQRATDELLTELSRSTMKVMNWFAYILIPPYFVFLFLDISYFAVLSDREFRRSGYWTFSEQTYPVDSIIRVRTGCRLFEDEGDVTFKYVVEFPGKAEMNLFDARARDGRLRSIERFDALLAGKGVAFTDETLSGLRRGEPFTNDACLNVLAVRYDRELRDRLLKVLRLAADFAKRSL